MINAINIVLNTERLILQRLKNSFAPLILELLNTQGWIKFIGDRNVHSIEDANNYIDKSKSNQNIAYWAVTIANTNTPRGLVT
ncbi:MAG: hypothetical protein KA319_04695, partial [Ferruginibacter sp.]|nr:hypothetical protein [Ferruginibacter sp.]